MIDLNEVEAAARKPWYCRSKLEDNLLSPKILVELITSLREAEKDAARYRWLCKQAWFQVEAEWQLSISDTETEEEFIIGASEKIDQAMKESGDE